jgi:hypothetical protein
MSFIVEPDIDAYLKTLTDEYLIENPDCQYEPNRCIPPQENASCRSCNNNLAGNNPASQYQRLKIIQRTVRVPASLYTMNLAALNVYQKPFNKYQVVDVAGSNYLVAPGVNWNQMSDRKEPHKQVIKTGSGSTYGASSTRHTITRLRPGALSPGGTGVDIKHNSYQRYLNRIKGKGPVRRGVIPPDFGIPYIPFNRAYPIYGGKTIKTSIVSGCDCGDQTPSILYNNSGIENNIYNVTYTYGIGDKVWVDVNRTGKNIYAATIIGKNGDLYVVKSITECSTDGSIAEVPPQYLSLILCHSWNCDKDCSVIQEPTYGPGTGLVINYDKKLDDIPYPAVEPWDPSTVSSCGHSHH